MALQSIRPLFDINTKQRCKKPSTAEMGLIASFKKISKSFKIYCMRHD